VIDAQLPAPSPAQASFQPPPPPPQVALERQRRLAAQREAAARITATDAYKAHPPMRRQPPLYELTSQVCCRPVSVRHDTLQSSLPSVGVGSAQVPCAMGLFYSCALALLLSSVQDVCRQPICHHLRVHIVMITEQARCMTLIQQR